MGKGLGHESNKCIWFFWSAVRWRNLSPEADHQIVRICGVQVTASGKLQHRNDAPDRRWKAARLDRYPNGHDAIGTQASFAHAKLHATIWGGFHGVAGFFFLVANAHQRPNGKFLGP